MGTNIIKVSSEEMGADMKNNRKWGKILVKSLLFMLCAVIAVAVFAIAFLRLWPAFGSAPDNSDKSNYAARAENYTNGAFVNNGSFSIMGESTDSYAGRTSGKGDTPTDTLPVISPTFLEDPPEDELTITWFGHSTSLLQMQGMNILFDPVFSEISSPVSFVGVRRFSPLPMETEELPYIDIVIISHDHYDHLDYPTIKAIDGTVDHYIVPLGVENHLERWGVAEEKIITMAWWEEIQVNGLTVACTPARHYSGRSLNDRNASLWASWVLRNDFYQVFESGDTGYGGHFSQIDEKYGPFDLALVDCAQYDTAWHDVHMFPEEAAAAAGELNAQTVMPIHWGAFKLANHAWDDPAERLVQGAEDIGLTANTPMLGETVTWGDRENHQARWWRELK